jgi:hypothetical protein
LKISRSTEQNADFDLCLPGRAKKVSQKPAFYGVSYPEAGMEMESTHQNDPQIIKIQGMLDSYLTTRELRRGADSTDAGHLDEDSLSAFVEGRISERESIPFISHLVDCSFCRHVTTELVRLDSEMAESEVVAAPISTREPSKVSEVLSGILERMFGTGESAVFAHGDEEKDEAAEKDPESPKN